MLIVPTSSPIAQVLVVDKKNKIDSTPQSDQDSTDSDTKNVTSN